MRGTILLFDDKSGNGLIRADDGQRYQFADMHWMYRGERPMAGQLVDFVAAEGTAKDIIAVLLPEGAPPSGDRGSQAGSDGSMLGAFSIGAGTLGLTPALGIVFSILGLILGIVARKRAKASRNDKGALLGTIGIGVSSVTFVLAIPMLMLGFTLLGLWWQW